jgi:circadian clock protein KaiC
MNESKSGNRTKAVSTGITGFDGILDGGYASNRVHLIEGQPGTGKTTLALQFLLDGARKGERCLYITLSRDRTKDMASDYERAGAGMAGPPISRVVPEYRPKMSRNLCSTCRSRLAGQASV